MHLDALLTELWSSETRYNLITDNIGIAYLKAALDASTTLTTGMLNSQRLYFTEAKSKEPTDCIVEYVRQYSYANPNLILGISATQWRLPELKHLVEKVRNLLPEVVIIAGGYGPTFVPAATLSFGVTAVCLGEGDRTVVELVQALRGEKRFEEVAGIAYYNKGALVTTQTRQLIDGKDIPIPSLDYINGRNLGDAEYTYAHRGCPYSCDFCFIHRFYKKGAGRVWRPKPASSLHAELRIRRLKNPNLQVILLGDDNFLVEDGFLEELRDLIHNDTATRGLKLEFGLGAHEINRHWPTIIRCMDIITKVELGYESRVASFLLRQKKGPNGVNMADENLWAMQKLQWARRHFQHFDYAAFHIVADRHSTLEELAQVYPSEDQLDKVEWAVKILKSGPNVVMYFDYRDDTYPLFTRAYCFVLAALSQFATFLPWAIDNVSEHYKSSLGDILEMGFDKATQSAREVHERHGSKRGHYCDIDEDLRQRFSTVANELHDRFHHVLAAYFVDLIETLLVGRPLARLLTEPWFRGYSARLLNKFGEGAYITAPPYVKLFAAIMQRYEDGADQLLQAANNSNLPDFDAATELYGRGLVWHYKSFVNMLADMKLLAGTDQPTTQQFALVNEVIDELVQLGANKSMIC